MLTEEKYQQFSTDLLEVISRHKWLKSEERKHDVGYEVALKDWLETHGKKWLEEELKKMGLTQKRIRSSTSTKPKRKTAKTKKKTK